MQPINKLTRTLSDLVALLEEEASQNPHFAKKLETVLSDLPDVPKKRAKRAKPTTKKILVPDVLVVFQDKGETEFKFWLRDFDLATLKAIVKENGFDLGKKSQRWKEPDKFVELITEQTAARLKRGSTFLTPKE